MNRKTYCELMNALTNIAQESEYKPHYCIVTRNRHILASSEDIRSMENGILISTGDEVIAMPYSSIEYISV